MSWHIYLLWGFCIIILTELIQSTKPRVQLIIIPNNEYGKYYLGAAARPEYGSVFRVSLPITGLLRSWSLDNIVYIHRYNRKICLALGIQEGLETIDYCLR